MDSIFKCTLILFCFFSLGCQTQETKPTKVVKIEKKTLPDSTEDNVHYLSSAKLWKEENKEMGSNISEQLIMSLFLEKQKMISSLSKNSILIKEGTLYLDENIPSSKYISKTYHLKPFKIMSKEVTFNQYDIYAKLTGRINPDDEGWGRGDRPVINVSWFDAVGFADWMSKQTGKNYRLPTNAEWEYAARAGTTTKYFWGDKIGTNNANCMNCKSRWDGQKTAPTGSFKANPWGLFDMQGNVWEWTSDCITKLYHGNVTTNCGQRIARGGSWNYSKYSLKSGANSVTPVFNQHSCHGFRLVEAEPSTK